MPHIHNQPNQHDITVSGWIVREINGEWKCLVHYHKKMDVLMQIGGHIELNETPWQAMAHELEEESGYKLGDVDVLQFTADQIPTTTNVSHPTPFSMNTHLVGNEHFHSDICYGFVAGTEPIFQVAEGETNDLRWMSLFELDNGAIHGEVLKDVAATYRFLISHVNEYVYVPAANFSIDKPLVATATYKRGAPGQL